MNKWFKNFWALFLNHSIVSENFLKKIEKLDEFVSNSIGVILIRISKNEKACF